MAPRAQRSGIGVLSSSLILGVVLLAAGNARAQLRPLHQAAAPNLNHALTTHSAQAELAGDHAKALQLADQAIKTDPRDPWGYFDRGDALESLNRIDDAVLAYR